MKELKTKLFYGCICAAILIIFGIVKMQQITLSVIVPVYNAEKYLAQCLDSIVNQDGKFEIIAINDGSTDKSLNILQQYAKKYSNIKVITQKNQGVSASRNRGISEAQGDYIIFVDSDDWLEEDAFEQILKQLKKDSPDILLTAYYDVYDKEWIKNTRGEEVANQEQEAKFPISKLDNLSLFSPFYGKDAYSDLFYSGTGVRGQVFRKNFIEEHKFTFPLGINCGEDDVFIYRAFLANPLISIIKSPLYNYRNRTDSLAKSRKVMTENRKGLAILQQTEEFKSAKRRTQMLINDAWLSWTILGISNIMRHGEKLDKALEEAYKAYNTFSTYNREERKSCRNLKRLRGILFPGRINHSL